MGNSSTASPAPEFRPSEEAENRPARVGATQPERYTDEVDKNEYSHICEAGEYLMLGGGEGAEIHERRQRGWNVQNLPRQAADWGM